MNYSKTLSQDINRLKEELNTKESELKRIQDNCKHEWGETIYDAEDTTEAIFVRYEGHGSDPIPVFDYIPKKKPRWKRECKKCTKLEYTYTQEEIKTYKPKF